MRKQKGLSRWNKAIADFQVSWVNHEDFEWKQWLIEQYVQTWKWENSEYGNAMVWAEQHVSWRQKQKFTPNRGRFHSRVDWCQLQKKERSCTLILRLQSATLSRTVTLFSAVHSFLSTRGSLIKSLETHSVIVWFIAFISAVSTNLQWTRYASRIFIMHIFKKYIFGIILN